MNHRVALNFEDGVTRFVFVKSNETIADAAYRERINIPVDCRDGACGTCKSRCESGTYRNGGYLEEALSAEEASEGYCLPCQMRPTSDCVLQISTSSAACKIQLRRTQTLIEDLQFPSPSTIVLQVRLTPEDAATLQYLPGQYIHLEIPATSVHRAYSFSSAPGSLIAKFLIRRIPGGVMSTFLAENAKVGEQLSLLGPYGSFYLRTVERPVLMLAGGTGLAPFLAMLTHLSELRSALVSPIHLVYGVTNDVDLVEVDTLERLTVSLPGFTFATCVASSATIHPKRGFVTDHLPFQALMEFPTDAYLCGPPPMVEAVRNEFLKRGIVTQNFYYEKFAPSEEVLK
jgi:benzoate/toluate 1,2-dioxygenase reductase component